MTGRLSLLVPHSVPPSQHAPPTAHVDEIAGKLQEEETLGVDRGARSNIPAKQPEVRCQRWSDHWSGFNCTEVHSDTERPHLHGCDDDNGVCRRCFLVTSVGGKHVKRIHRVARLIRSLRSTNIGKKSSY